MKCNLNFFLLISSVLINYCVSQNCSPCKCQTKTMDCSKETIKQVITKIPNTTTITTEELILKDQTLESISNRSFPNMENLRILNLENCKLNFVHRDSFKFMPNLTEINLSQNEIVSLDKNIFRYNEKLRKIKINNNKLHIIKVGTFVRQKLLTHLFLQNNEIPNITKEAFPNYPGLKILDLTKNKLNYVDGKLIQQSEDLKEIYLDDNPFKCDCHLKPFFQAMKEKDFSGINSKCSEPKSLENEALIDLSAADFACPINMSTIMNQNITAHRDQVNLSCTIELESEPYVMWKFNQDMIFDGGNKYVMTKQHINGQIFQYNLTINELNKNDSGQYCCVAKNTGFSNQVTFNLKVKPAEVPKILVPGKNFVFVDLHEENYTIPFKVFGIPKPVVSWSYRDKILYSNESSFNRSVYCNDSSVEEDNYWFNLTIKKVKLKYRTEFLFIASNFKGTVNKTITLVILYPHRVTFEAVHNFIETEETKNVTVMCGVKAVPRPNIIWRFGHLGIDPNISPNKYKLKLFRDDSGTYWSKLTILRIEMFESGIYKCEANNSDEVEVQRFTIVVNTKINEDPSDNITTKVLIISSCIILSILIIIIILKCCIRYHISKNSTTATEYSFRASIMSKENV